LVGWVGGVGLVWVGLVGWVGGVGLVWVGLVGWVGGVGLVWAGLVEDRLGGWTGGKDLCNSLPRRLQELKDAEGERLKY